MAREYPQFINQAPTITTLNELYRQHKREHYLLDYDDLLLEGRRLLRDHEDLRLELSQRCQYIMVDEYQDTNRLQSELVKLLAFTHDNVMAVGDDSQSIYSFRGANFHNIMDFPGLFPGTRIIKLEENYRSTQPILDLTNTIIAEASEKYTKCLFTQKKEGPKPVLLQAGSENEQSRFVCEAVAELQKQGTSLHNIAVLFRSAYHSFDLEIELLQQHLPFMKFGGFKFMESAHIKDLLAHLRVAANPRDSVSWNRLLQLVPGIGKKSAQKFLAQLKQEEFSLEGALQWLASQKSAKARAGLESLADLLEQLRNPDLGPATRLSLALSYYEPILQTHFDDYPKRQKDLKSLFDITARYRKLGRFPKRPDPGTTQQHGRNRRGPRGIFDPLHHSFSQGAGMGRGLYYLGRGRTVSLRLFPGARRGTGRGAAVDVRGRHPGQTLFVYLLSRGELYEISGDNVQYGLPVCPGFAPIPSGIHEGGAGLVVNSNCS